MRLELLGSYICNDGFPVRPSITLQFSPEMGLAGVGLMSPAPGRSCEDVSVRMRRWVSVMARRRKNDASIEAAVALF